MDELLEVVSEAVANMVEYAVDADDRNARVIDIPFVMCYIKS
jgi:hypothetical protein